MCSPHGDRGTKRELVLPDRSLSIKIEGSEAGSDSSGWYEDQDICIQTCCHELQLDGERGEEVAEGYRLLLCLSETPRI